MNQIYLDTARLLTQVAPFIFFDGTFALKGGTAINLFVRDMPRLSVDLDLVFADHQPPRTSTHQRCSPAVRRPSQQARFPYARINVGGGRRNQAAGAARCQRDQDRSQFRDPRHGPPHSQSFLRHHAPAIPCPEIFGKTTRTISKV
jgi:Nucleotidyl transferase AbiEii toxin, Type IV TA system